MNARVLIIGSGGREHALAYALNESPDVAHIIVAPGNGGTQALEKVNNLQLEEKDVADYCVAESIDMVVIGPEAPLVNGLADELRGKGIPTFGPSQAGAQLEGSKAFATRFMQENDIPIPPSTIVTNAEDAHRAIKQYGGSAEAVIKADGLAGGKGVFLPRTATEAKIALDAILGGEVDKDGGQIIIQKRFHGPEVSVFVLSDGDNYKIIPLTIQDHKRLLKNDEGPNTGGMGVYAPLPKWMVSDQQWQSIEKITHDTIVGMKTRGTPYQGVLYLGVMLAEETNGEPIVIEYNARFGDPEAEVIMPMLLNNSVDVFQMLHATATQQLAAYVLPEKLVGSALCVCLAADGYPQSPIKGAEIRGADVTYDQAVVFHGGTTKGETLTVNGGRVLFIAGFGDTLSAAAASAYAAIGNNGVHFDGMQLRDDIGFRALKK